MRLSLGLSAALLASGTAHNAVAQAGFSNALASATDAFGERAGREQSGLYSENQVRGMSPQAAGAYRIEGAYFFRAASLPDVLTEGSSVRVGLGAARLYSPSPSGVVAYRLPEISAEADGETWEVGVADYLSPYAQLTGVKMGAGARWGVSYGASGAPRSRYGDGTGGYRYAVGISPQWAPSQRVRVRGLLSREWSAYNGDYSFLNPAATDLPATPRIGRSYGPRWARNEQVQANAGLIIESTPSRRLAVTNSIFYSQQKTLISDFTALTLRSAGTASALFIRSPERDNRSWSFETRGAYQIRETAPHVVLLGGVRGRRSVRTDGRSSTTDMGLIDLKRPVYPAEMPVAILAGESRDQVQQLTGTLGASVTFSRVSFRTGLHRSRYTKDVKPFGGPAAGSQDNVWLFDASVVADLTRRTTVYASATRGLEESGAPPRTVANPNALLPAVKALGREAGLRYLLGDNLTLVTTVFEIEKPLAGVDAANLFTFVGKVRHTGAEISLAGQVVPSLRVVAGATLMRPRLSGDLVDRGISGSRPTGVAQRKAFIGTDYAVTGIDGLSLDAQLTLEGERPANLANTYDADGVTRFNLGARYRFDLGERPAVLRLVAGNVTERRSWNVSPGGTFSLPTERSIRMSLSISDAS